MSETKVKAMGSKGVLQDSGKKELLSRRGFLTRSGAVAVGVAVLPTAGMMVSKDAYALDMKSLNESAGKTLVKIARDIFPHDKVPDKFYASAIAAYDEKTGSDPKLKALLDKGVAQLNAAAISRYGKAYAEIPGRANASFFSTISSNLSSSRRSAVT